MHIPLIIISFKKKIYYRIPLSLMSNLLHLVYGGGRPMVRITSPPAGHGGHHETWSHSTPLRHLAPNLEQLNISWGNRSAHFHDAPDTRLAARTRYSFFSAFVLLHASVFLLALPHFLFNWSTKQRLLADLPFCKSCFFHLSNLQCLFK